MLASEVNYPQLSRPRRPCSPRVQRANQLKRQRDEFYSSTGRQGDTTQAILWNHNTRDGKTVTCHIYTLACRLGRHDEEVDQASQRFAHPLLDPPSKLSPMRKSPCSPSAIRAPRFSSCSNHVLRSSDISSMPQATCMPTRHTK